MSIRKIKIAFLCGISRQAVGDMCKRGRLDLDKNGLVRENKKLKSFIAKHKGEKK